MSKAVHIIGIILGIGLIISQPDIANALFAFVFAGVVPFTHIVLPFWAMLLIIGAIAFAALLWLTRQPFFIGDTPNAEKTAKKQARNHVLATVAKHKKTPAKKSSIKSRLRKQYRTATS